jgi:hypothetical protein
VACVVFFENMDVASVLDKLSIRRVVEAKAGP